MQVNLPPTGRGSAGHRPSLQAGCQKAIILPHRGVKSGSNKSVCDSPNHGSPNFGLQDA